MAVGPASLTSELLHAKLDLLSDRRKALEAIEQEMMADAEMLDQEIEEIIQGKEATSPGDQNVASSVQLRQIQQSLWNLETQLVNERRQLDAQAADLLESLGAENPE